MKSYPSVRSFLQYLLRSQDGFDGSWVKGLSVAPDQACPSLGPVRSLHPLRGLPSAQTPTKAPSRLSALKLLDHRLSSDLIPYELRCHLASPPVTLLTALFYSPPSPPQNGLKAAYRVTLKHRVNLKEVGLGETRHRDGSQHPEASMTASVDPHRWATGQGLSFLAARGKTGHRPSEEPAEQGLGCVLEQVPPQTMA